MAARWRNQPSERGLARVCQAPRGFELREGSEVVIRVEAMRKGDRLEGWYWYGLDRNTSAEGNLKATKEEAKADADACYKAWKAEKKGEERS